MTIQIDGILEIDQNRGVIYFHSKKTGHYPLRICRLPKPIPDPSPYDVSLEISHMHSCNWEVFLNPLKDSPKKGELNGICMRKACSNKPALHFNKSTLKYYCRECAELIANTCKRLFADL